MCMVRKTSFAVTFLIDVVDKLGIPNVKGPILLCENGPDELDPPISVNAKGIYTTTV